MSDRGYGPGIFLVGAHYDDTTGSSGFIMWKPTTLIIPQYVDWWRNFASDSQGLNYKLAPITDYGKTYQKWPVKVTEDIWKTKVFIGPISDAYQQRIGFMEPELKIFQFYDAGDVNLDFMCIHNGYAYEVPGSRTYEAAKDGVESIFENFTDSNRGGLHLKKKVPGGSTAIELKNIKAQPKETWFNITSTVVPGEEWYLTADYDDYGDNRFGFYYGLLFYQSQIPGWELKTP